MKEVYSDWSKNEWINHLKQQPFYLSDDAKIDFGRKCCSILTRVFKFFSPTKDQFYIHKAEVELEKIPFAEGAWQKPLIENVAQNQELLLFAKMGDSEEVSKLAKLTPEERKALLKEKIVSREKAKLNSEAEAMRAPLGDTGGLLASKMQLEAALVELAQTKSRAVELKAALETLPSSINVLEGQKKSAPLLSKERSAVKKQIKECEIALEQTRKHMEAILQSGAGFTTLDQYLSRFESEGAKLNTQLEMHEKKESALKRIQDKLDGLEEAVEGQVKQMDNMSVLKELLAAETPGAVAMPKVQVAAAVGPVVSVKKEKTIGEIFPFAGPLSGYTPSDMRSMVDELYEKRALIETKMEEISQPNLVFELFQRVWLRKMGSHSSDAVDRLLSYKKHRYLLKMPGVKMAMTALLGKNLNNADKAVLASHIDKFLKAGAFTKVFDLLDDIERYVKDEKMTSEKFIEDIVPKLRQILATI